MAKRSRRVRPARRGTGSPTIRPEAAALTVRYIESSALVAALLENDAAARQSLRVPGRRFTSALTLAETARAILRARTNGRLTAQTERTAVRALQLFERRCYVVAVTDDILWRVRRSFPVEPIRTLDAVHLATLETLGEPPPLVVVLTRDERVRANALALGYATE